MPQLLLTAPSKTAALWTHLLASCPAFFFLLYVVFSGLFVQIDTLFSPIKCPLYFENGSWGTAWGGLSLLLSAPPPLSAWHGEGTSVCEILNVCLLVWRQYPRLQAGLVPACLELVTSSPGWGLPTVPRRWIKELREGPGRPSCGPGRRQVSKALPSPGRPGGTTTGSQ